MKKVVAGFVLAMVTMSASPAGAQSATSYSWGAFGEHGPQNTPVLTPTAVTGIPGTVKQIVATNAATYALASGHVYAFGAGKLGELGQKTPQNSFKKPLEVHFPKNVVIASLPNSMPYSMGMAIDTNNNVWVWGSNNAGQACLGFVGVITTPRKVKALPDVTVATGAGTHAVYDSQGQLYGCGSNADGQLGDGQTDNQNYDLPVQALPLPSPVVALGSAWADTGALLQNGQYYDWGEDTQGQLGDGQWMNNGTPRRVTFPNDAMPTSVALGGNDMDDGQTVALLQGGGVAVWGDDSSGQLCDGQAMGDEVNQPEIITPSTTWDYVTSGGSDIYAVDSSNELWGCGSETEGALGNGTSSHTGIESTPIPILSGVTVVSSESRNVAAM